MALVDGVDWELLVQALVAIGIGGLIGLERERHRNVQVQAIYAGIRTMPLVALSGTIVAWLSITWSYWVLVAGTIVFGGFAWMIIWSRQGQERSGFTTAVSFLVTYLLGVLVGNGRIVTAAALGIIAAFLLLERATLHRFAQVVGPSELRSAIIFLLIAAILLPLAPTDAIDPWDAFVPRTFVLIVVIVSIVSFLGFLAMRFMGPARGMVVSGVLAGLVDSDAAAGAVAALARGREALHKAALRAGLLATTTGFLRNIVIVAIATVAGPGLGLLWVVGPVFLAMAAMPVIWAVVKTRGLGDTPHEVPRIRSPFALGPALKFAVFFAVITFAAALLQRIPGAGDQVVYLTAVGGFVSSAAVVASMGVAVAQGTVSVQVAAVTAALAAACSAAIKPVMVGVVYRPIGRGLVAPSMFAALVAVAGAVVIGLA